MGPAGTAGPQGVQGIQGPAGPAGSTGPQGIQGIQGQPGTLGAIDGVYQSFAELQTAVPTGQAGHFYYIDPDLYIWDLVSGSWKAIGPVAGPQGITGPQGPAGPAGIAGPAGPQGIQGLQGPKGDAGATGAAGSQGVQGVQGTQGIQGIAGTTGVAGPQGIQGIRGATGATGPQGIQGVAGATGAAGPQGIQGVAGVTGATGPQGIQGVAGVTGATGPRGLQGIQGATGADGFSPAITVSDNTPSSYVLNITDKNGSYQTPNLRQKIDGIYSANLASPGSSLSVPVGNMTYTVNYQDAGSVRVQLGASSGTVLADVKKFAQYDGGGLNSASWDSTTFTSTPTLIDANVYNRSNESHVTTIRQRDPATGLWSVYAVHLFTSANSSRTNVWVEQIASGLSF